MNPNQYAGLLGFAFVAIWAAASLGTALLCLIGAGVAAGISAYRRGELDLVELQDRLAPRDSRRRR